MKTAQKQFSPEKLKQAMDNYEVIVRWLALELTKKVDQYIDQTRIYRWLKGEAVPDGSMILLFGQIFDRPMADFYEENEDKKNV